MSREQMVAAAAEAIWRAEVGAAFDELYPWAGVDSETTGEHYRRMAAAAVDAVLEAMSPDEVWEWKNQ